MRSHEAMYRFRKPEFLVEDSRASLGIWNHLRKGFFSGEIFPSILQVVKKRVQTTYGPTLCLTCFCKNLTLKTWLKSTKLSRLWGFIPWDCQMRSLPFRLVGLRHFGKMLFLMVFTTCFFSKFLCFSLGPTSAKLSEVGVLQLHHLGWRFTRKWCKICWRKWCYVHLPHGSRSLQAILVSRNKKVMTVDGFCFLLLACVEPYFRNMVWCLPRWYVGLICLIRTFFYGGAASERVEVLILISTRSTRKMHLF